MDFLKLPEEVQKLILQQLPLLSILSCSHAVPQARHITTSDRFPNIYVQQALQAPWVKFDMVRKFESFCFPVYRLWYLETLSSCHKELAFLCKMSHPLHSFGLFIYVLTSWVALNKRENFPPRKELCPECSSYPFLHSVISDTDTRKLLTQFALGYPEIFTLTVLYTDDQYTEIGDWEPESLEYTLEEVAAKKSVDTGDFGYKYHILICYLVTNGVNDELGWWSLVVGDRTWIVVSGFNDDMFGCCYMKLGSSFVDTSDAFRSVVKPMADWMKSEIDFTEEDFCYNTRTLRRICETNVNKICAALNKLSTTVQKEGKKIAEYINSLHVKANMMQKMESLINTNFKEEEKVSSKSDLSEAAIIAHLHRLLQKVFSEESQKYLDDKHCQSFLQMRVDDQEDSEGSEGSEESQGDSEHLSVTSSPLGLWPIFLLHHSLIVIPVLGRLLLKDLKLVKEGCEGKPLSQQNIELLTAETHRCGLVWSKSRQTQPPLCKQIRYC